GGQAGGDAAGAGGRGGARRGGGDLGVHELPARALDAHPNEQPAGAAEPGDQAADAGGGDVPRRRVGVDAGGGAAAGRGPNQVGHATLPEHGQAAGRRARGGGGDAEELGAGTHPFAANALSRGEGRWQRKDAWEQSGGTRRGLAPAPSYRRARLHAGCPRGCRGEKCERVWTLPTRPRTCRLSTGATRTNISSTRFA